MRTGFIEVSKVEHFIDSTSIGSSLYTDNMIRSIFDHYQKSFLKSPSFPSKVKLQHISHHCIVLFFYYYSVELPHVGVKDSTLLV